MKKTVIAIVVLLFTCSLTFAEDGKKFGKDLTLTETTKVSTILETPDEFEGKRVLIEGVIVGVCKKAGCWIDIASDKEEEKIRIKVNDGEIVFPMEIKGKTAKVEGEVYSIVVTPESCEGEGGTKPCSEEDSDTSKNKKSEQVSKKYMIKGIGAIVE